jgi:hypothetical protein
MISYPHKKEQRMALLHVQQNFADDTFMSYVFREFKTVIQILFEMIRLCLRVMLITAE